MSPNELFGTAKKDHKYKEKDDLNLADLILELEFLLCHVQFSVEATVQSRLGIQLANASLHCELANAIKSFVARRSECCCCCENIPPAKSAPNHCYLVNTNNRFPLCICVSELANRLKRIWINIKH